MMSTPWLRNPIDSLIHVLMEELETLRDRTLALSDVLAYIVEEGDDCEIHKADADEGFSQTQRSLIVILVHGFDNLEARVLVLAEVLAEVALREEVIEQGS